MTFSFDDPTKIKKQKPKDQPEDGKNSPWDYRCPQYDQRSSRFLNAGTDYGIGFAQPIGHTGKAKQTVSVLPQKSKCGNIYETDEEN